MNARRTESLIPLTPGECSLLVDAARETRRHLRLTTEPAPRLVVRSERDRWAMEYVAKLRGIDVTARP